MLVVTPNTCIDITSRLAELTPGTVSRSTLTTHTAGGKGVNVCRTLANLGVPARLIGLSSTDDPRLERFLSQEQIDFVPIAHRGPARVALIVLESGGRTTVINGQGPGLDDWEAEGFVESICAEMADCQGVICSGSLPPGLPDSSYGTIVEAAHRLGMPAFVDAAPPVLKATLDSEPDLVSPNLSEAEAMLFGRKDERVEESGDDIDERCVEAAQKLHRAGASRAIVTAGSRGAAMAAAEGTWWVDAATVEVANPIGAGDSFLAGTSAALVGGAGDRDALRRGMAVAAAAVQHEQGGMLDSDRIDEAMAMVGTARAR